jgi:AmiR/NasT family two-component response regulator
MSVRVLVVEDEFMIALDISQQLTDAGCEIVGPAKSVTKALGLIAESGCDVAVLDVNLGGETSELIAQKLQEVGKPFIILSGYSTEEQPPWFNGATVLRKPPPAADLLAAVRGCVATAS